MVLFFPLIGRPDYFGFGFGFGFGFRTVNRKVLSSVIYSENVRHALNEWYANLKSIDAWWRFSCLKQYAFFFF